MKQKRTSKYWICIKCAKKKKWKAPQWPVTCMQGLCGHCKSMTAVTLIPTSDFRQGRKAAVWD